MVEGARLEIVWAAMSRRFESSRFRQEEIKLSRKARFFWLRISEDLSLHGLRNTRSLKRLGFHDKIEL